MNAEYRPRVKGSCRFSPYFKAQWYDEKILAWRDISERFKTANEARVHFDNRKKWRVMEITMEGRNAI